MIKKTFLAIACIILVISTVAIIKTTTLSSKQLVIDPIPVENISDRCVESLQKAIQIPTITYDQYANFDSTAFYDFIDFLKVRYPLCDSLLEVQHLNEFGLLYTWKGSKEKIDPIVLMAHYDVVPIAPGTENDWKADPFSGLIKDGLLWGRGALDDKLNVITILEAAELLLAEGFTPDRTFYFSFGFDEEIGGAKGAQAVVAQFEKQGVHPEFVMDEGLAITNNLVPGVKEPVALIGTAQKGYLTLELSVHTEGGHSSMPSDENAMTIIAAAVNKLQENPFPAEFCPPVRDFLDRAGPEMPFATRLAIANMWLLEGVVQGQYAKSKSGNALVRTTTAPTIFHAGVKENVIPAEASATINFRILPGHTRESVTEDVRQLIDDERIRIKTLPVGADPSPVASIESMGYQTLERTIREVYPSAVVAPSLVLAATDARHFSSVSESVLCFAPMPVDADVLSTIHGVNEKVPVEAVKDAVRFYKRLIENCQESEVAN